MTSLLYLLGFLPSFVWLLFYLRKDAHPESNWMVVKMFVFGMLSALLAIYLEKGFQKGEHLFVAAVTGTSITSIFVGGALIEEYVKYFMVKLGGLRNRELDEPCDVMIYMIIVALGFAALENILVLNNFHPTLTVSGAIEIMTWRFISATFLHALCSGLLGYFIALSFLHTKKRLFYLISGIIVSTALHGMYNWSIMTVEGNKKLLLPAIILIALGCFVSYGFKKLKKLKGKCSVIA
jgi:RsiW-degrading membrane proteinase PrsW (M82 family)